MTVVWEVIYFTNKSQLSGIPKLVYIGDKHLILEAFKQCQIKWNIILLTILTEM